MMSKTNLANPFDDAAAPIFLETPEDNQVENPAKKTTNVIKLSKEDLRREHQAMPREPREDVGEFYRCAANKGRLDAGRTIRSGYAYDFDSTDPVSPRDAARAAGIKAELGDEPLHGIENRYAYRFVKRAFDIVFSAAVIVVFSWLLIIIAIAVKIDDPKGPVFFKQLRCTKGGRQFYMLKFRSMCVDAEEKLAELQELNEKSGPVFKIADDPRITRVGKWLRKLSIDELPQFFNVIAGDMSVVGPRPALPAEVEKYTEYQKQRLLVQSGLAWDIIAPKLGAGKKVSRTRVLPAYEGSRVFRAVAA